MNNQFDDEDMTYNEVEKYVNNVGNNLSMAASLSKFLDASMTDNFEEVNKQDISNLVLLLNKIMRKLLDDFSRLEVILENQEM
jgi:phage portal protein BeeE